MNTINDNLLIDYVLDLIDETDRKAIDTEMLTSSDLCRRIAHLRDILVLPILDCERAEPSDNLHQRILNSVQVTHSFEGFVDRLTVFLDMSGTHVRELLERIDSEKENWEPSGFPGVLQKEFVGGPRHSDSECALIRINPGSTFPTHNHSGDEWGFILQGEAREDSGKISRPGAMVYHTMDHSHSVSAIGDLPLIFVVIHQGITFR